MKELQFIASREAEWEAWERTLADTPPRKGKAAAELPAEPAPLVLENLPRAFRRLSGDLALARDRHYSTPLQDRLHGLVLAAHQRIYGARKREGNAFFHFLMHGFPQAVRREWRVVSLAGLLLFLPFFAMLLILQWSPDGVYLLISPDKVHQIEEMYSPTARHLGRPRDASSEWMMWGFYIANNVKIDFQCFAGGLAFGVGAVFFLLFNGLHIGAVAGHLTQMGLIDTFWGFVAGHSAFELTGAMLSGAAGLKLGTALIAPGNFSRGTALRHAAVAALPLIWGAAGLTFLAAFIEAFWSPGRFLPVMVKYWVGGLLWLCTWSYLLLAGRGSRAA